MKLSALASRKEKALKSIASKLNIDIPRFKGDVNHRELHVLELLDVSISTSLDTAKDTAVPSFTLDDILAIDGLSVKSKKAIKEALS